jgi:hypothetical protein
VHTHRTAHCRHCTHHCATAAPRYLVHALHGLQIRADLQHRAQPLSAAPAISARNPHTGAPSGPAGRADTSEVTVRKVAPKGAASPAPRSALYADAAAAASWGSGAARRCRVRPRTSSITPGALHPTQAYPKPLPAAIAAPVQRRCRQLPPLQPAAPPQPSLPPPSAHLHHAASSHQSHSHSCHTQSQ